MEQEVYFPRFRTKLSYLLVKWEEKITFVTILCAILAIGLGIVWIVLKEMMLLYLCLAFSSCYFLGKKF